MEKQRLPERTVTIRGVVPVPPKRTTDRTPSYRRTTRSAHTITSVAIPERQPSKDSVSLGTPGSREVQQYAKTSTPSAGRIRGYVTQNVPTGRETPQYSIVSKPAKSAPAHVLSTSPLRTGVPARGYTPSLSPLSKTTIPVPSSVSAETPQYRQLPYRRPETLLFSDV